MRIAIFSDTFAPQVNGVAHTALAMANMLTAHGHVVEVFTVRCKERNEKYNFVINEVVSIPFWGYPGERMTLPLGFTLWKIFRFKPDVIHTHTPFALGWEAVLASKIFSIPIIGTHHTFFDYYLKHIRLDFDWVKHISWKYVSTYYNRCTAVMVPSNSMLGRLREYNLYRPAGLLQNSIDTDLFEPASDEEKRKLKAKFNITGSSMVYMGRVSYEKSIPVLIDVLAALQERGIECTLMIIGDGPDTFRIQKAAADKHVSLRVIFTGFLHGNELVSALQANDVFVTASKSENMPLSVVEGMAVGLPIIGVRSLGIPEIVLDGINGYTVRPDNVSDFTQTIAMLLENRELLKKISVGSRNEALKYSFERNIKKLEGVYGAVINHQHENIPLSRIL